jgi:thioredoxin reductase (NADPH)
LIAPSKIAPLSSDVVLHPKIRPVLNSVLIEVLGDDQRSVIGLRLRNVKTGAESTLEAFGLFPNIGADPNPSLVRGQVEVHPSAM